MVTKFDEFSREDFDILVGNSRIAPFGVPQASKTTKDIVGLGAPEELGFCQGQINIVVCAVGSLALSANRRFTYKPHSFVRWCWS